MILSDGDFVYKQIVVCCLRLFYRHKVNLGYYSLHLKMAANPPFCGVERFALDFFVNSKTSPYD